MLINECNKRERLAVNESTKPLQNMVKLLTLLMILLPGIIFAQTKAKATYTYTLTGNSIVKDTKGTRIDVNSAAQLIQTGKYELEPVSDANGNIKEYTLKPKLSSESVITAQTENGGYSPATMPGPKRGQKMPEFSLTDINGRTFNATELKGKVIVMNFWFTRCVPCKNEIPDLNALRTAYKNNADVVFIAPSWENAETIKQFTATTTFNYNIVPGATALVKLLGIQAYPVNLVIGRDGRIVNSYVGGMVSVDDLLKQDIDAALAQKETAQNSQ
jgi:peroxiredoxin